MRFLLSSTLLPPRACRMALTRSVTAGRSDSRCFTRYWGSCAVCVGSATRFRLLSAVLLGRAKAERHLCQISPLACCESSDRSWVGSAAATAC